jgi:hypothetical protein
VSRATEVYSREFDSIIFKLAPPARELIEQRFTTSDRDWASIRIIG